MKPPTWPLYRLTETEDVNGLVAGERDGTEGETWREIAVRAETMHGRRYIFQVAKFCPDNMTADEVEAQLDFARGAVVEAVTNAIGGTEGDSVPAVTRDQLRQAWFNVNSFDTFVASVRDLGVPIDETPTERLAVLISEVADGGDEGVESYMDIAGKLVARGVTVEEGENDD